MKYQVFVDMDSTLNEFTKAYVNHNNMTFDDDLRLDESQLEHYEITKNIDLDEDENERRKEIIFRTPSFWVDIPIKPDAREVLEWMDDKFETFILTAPWLRNLDMFKEKLSWVKLNLPSFSLNNVIFSTRKDIIHGNNTIIIDDNPNMLETFQGIKIAFDYPFNRSVDVDGRISNWSEAKEVLGAYLDSEGQDEGRL